jgi:uncharacterized Ntn-hydrolase superfamily protein
MRSGEGAGAALASLLDGDPDAGYRQIAVVDSRGEVATHTGTLCIAEAGDETGNGFSTPANLMDRPTVWSAMAGAFAQSDGDLTTRLLAALEAAESEGGDVRGRQSAALVVAPAPGQDGPRFDLRVEDARGPVGELRRLVTLQRVYLELNRGDELMARGSFDDALASYEAASRMVPDAATDGEAAFWAGVAFATTARVDEAEPYLLRAAAFDDRWKRLLPRLVRSKMLPDDDALLRRLLDVMTRGR